MNYKMEELVPIVGKLAEKYTSFESTSFNNSLHYIKTILSDTSTKEKIIEFTKPQNVEIEDLGISLKKIQ